jgi:hypothetical protein
VRASMTSSSDEPFRPLRYLRYIMRHRPWWVRLSEGGMVPVVPGEEPDLRNWAIGVADAMNARAPIPDADWPVDRAAADAEVEADEQPRED